jgi:prepilin-type N-terminal cleavage/methylation domain-containing protein
VANYDLRLARTIVCAALSGEIGMGAGRLTESCRRTTDRGFTFIEVMIALVIFGCC